MEKVKKNKIIMSFFHAYGQVSQKILSYRIFIPQRKSQKYVLACILTLVTSLLKSRELDQYLKNT
jgi:hypothetical protein